MILLEELYVKGRAGFAPKTAFMSINHNYEGWNFNSGKYLFTTDTK